MLLKDKHVSITGDIGECQLYAFQLLQLADFESYIDWNSHTQLILMCNNIKGTNIECCFLKKRLLITPNHQVMMYYLLKSFSLFAILWLFALYIIKTYTPFIIIINVRQQSAWSSPQDLSNIMSLIHQGIDLLKECKQITAVALSSNSHSYNVFN